MSKEVFIPKVGEAYKNKNGDYYRCLSRSGTTAMMQRVSDGWTLTAHGLVQYSDGSIEWDFSSGGAWWSLGGSWDA